MFERFTREARKVVEEARERAAFFGVRTVGPDHLLLGVLFRPSPSIVTALSAFGDVSALATAAQGRLEAMDHEALDSVGISWDRVRDHLGDIAPASPEHVKFNRAAKKVLEGSLRQALRLRQKYIGPEHVMLALLQIPSARYLLECSDVDPNRLETQLLAELKVA